jgi:hydroxymethylglutaryl-CoA synthase
MRTSIMNPQREVGIVGYGAYVPRYRIAAAEIARVWKGEYDFDTPVEAKSVAGPDEDVVTMSIEAARNAMRRAGIDPTLVRAVWTGSESHPYAVKPSSTIVAQALGIAPATLAADFQFACKAGTEAMQAATALVGSGMGDYALAIGMDTAQARPGDALEYTAAAGGGAFLMGPASEAVAILEGSYSQASDTPDFWRREHERYPAHANRFTGEPAYFAHVLEAASTVMEALALQPQDFAAVVFHQPNDKFPRKVARQLGFSSDQLRAGLLSSLIGNCYAGASPLGLTRVLDEARAGDRVMIVSFGSGAGSDAMVYRVTERIGSARGRAPLTQDYLDRKVSIDYAIYARWQGKIA